MSRSDRTLDAALAKLAERAAFERVVSLYSRRYRLPPAEVADAVQTAFYKTLKTYAGKAVNAPEALLHQVIRNELITVIRRSDVVKMVELDEDFLALGSGGARRRTSDAGGFVTSFGTIFGLSVLTLAGQYGLLRTLCPPFRSKT